MSIAQQKSDLREIIYREVQRRIEEEPELAPIVAMGAIHRLSGKMTLNELQRWHLALFSDEIIAGITNKTA